MGVFNDIRVITEGAYGKSSYRTGLGGHSDTGSLDDSGLPTSNQQPMSLSLVEVETPLPQLVV
jgi:hypothetical protein